jgi:ribosomal subunit interface protein
MELPLQITSHDFALTPAIEAEIRERATKLDSYFDRIIRCRVTIDAPVGHHHRGGPFTVRVDLTVPRGELVVNRQTSEDLLVAIRDSFDAMRRRLEDYVRQHRGEVKIHESSPHGHVVKLFPEQGYGFLATADGKEIYFHCNSVLEPGFTNLKIGTEVRFVEEQGAKGPQASTVAFVGVPHHH